MNSDKPFNTRNNESQDTFNDIARYLKLNNIPIENTTPNKYGDCRHLHVVIDEQARTLTCALCKKQLDPFWYLCLLAKEWKSRCYRDIDAIKAHEALKQKQKNAEAKGKIAVKPTEGEGLIVWESYFALYQKDPDYIYIRGRGVSKQWITVGNNMHISFDVIKMELARKLKTENPKTE